ncbi:MAG: pseudouridine synthase, partial [Clostridia bacterium]|nr:pseudouridine synthase [Clostridia bacterium]
MKRVIREIKYIVSAAEDGLPLGRFLQRRGYSQQMLSDLKKEGLTVEGAFHRLIDPVRQGEEIGVAVFSEQNSLKANPLLKAELIYEDEDYLVFNKPADMLVHPCARQFADALGNYFAALYPDLLFRPLGRLDRNTTGAVLVAKHRLAAGLVK